MWPAPVSDWPLNSIDRVGGVGREGKCQCSIDGWAEWEGERQCLLVIFIYNTYCCECVLNSFNFFYFQTRQFRLLWVLRQC